MKIKKKFIVFYKNNKNDIKENFKLFDNLDDAFLYYTFKKEFCYRVNISFYQILI